MARPRKECGCHRRRRQQWKTDAKLNAGARSRLAASTLTGPAVSIAGCATCHRSAPVSRSAARSVFRTISFSWSATTSSSSRATWSGVRIRAWVWNFAPTSAPKVTVDRDQAVATAWVRHGLSRPVNSLIGNQFPSFPQRGKPLCHRRNSRSLFAQVRALPAFFKAATIVRRTPSDHDSCCGDRHESGGGQSMSRLGWLGTLRAGTALGILIIATAQANAGALAIREHSTYGQGTSFAGVAAGGSLSSMFWNPATMTQIPGVVSETVVSGIFPYANNTPVSGALVGPPLNFNLPGT